MAKRFQLAALALTVAAVTACGVGRPLTGHEDTSRLVRFTELEHAAVVGDLGSAHAFSYYDTVRRTFTVHPDSDAVINERQLSQPVFASARAHANWIALNRPPLARPNRQQVVRIPDARNNFSFFSSPGPPLSLRALDAMHWRQRDLAQTLRSFIGLPPAEIDNTVLLENYGNLLATAPLSRVQRRAIVTVAMATRGIKPCLGAKATAGSYTLCAQDRTVKIVVVIQRASLTASQVDEFLIHADPAFPDIPAGGILVRSQFGQG